MKRARTLGVVFLLILGLIGSMLPTQGAESPPSPPANPLQPPTAGFLSNSPVCLGRTAVFTDTSGGEIFLHEWDFGDGTVGTGSTPWHGYPWPGTYTVTLTVSGPEGSDSYSDTFEVRPAAEAFFWAEPSEASVGQPVRFLNLSQGALGYQWDLGDGTLTTEISPTHTYTEAGDYVVQLTALAAAPCQDSIYTTTLRVRYPTFLPVLYRAADPSIPYPKVETLAVSSPGPHQADGQDTATIVVTATAADGSPVPGRAVAVELYAGEDPGGVYPAVDNGDGTYTAQITSTVAADFLVLAVEYGSHQATTTTLSFLPGAPQTIAWAEVVRPADAITKDTALLVAVVEDAWGNPVPTTTASIVFTTDFGTLAQWEEEGYYYAQVQAADYGVAHVLAASALGVTSQAMTEVAFLPLYLEFRTLPGVGGELAVDVIVWAPSADLGAYNLELTFDPEVLHFKGLLDGDPTDPFPAPFYAISGTNTVVFYQMNHEGQPTPERIHIATCFFDVLGEADLTSLSLYPAKNDVHNLMDILGNPLLSQELYELLRPYLTWWLSFFFKLPKPVGIKVWLAPGAAPPLAAHLLTLNWIYWMHVPKCCPWFIFWPMINRIPPKVWNNINEGDSALDREERDALRARFNRPGCINVIYAPDDSLPGATGATITGDGIIMDGDALNNTLAHEIGHYYGLDDLYDAEDKDNLMYGYSNPAKWALTPDQCATITANDP